MSIRSPGLGWWRRDLQGQLATAPGSAVLAGQWRGSRLSLTLFSRLSPDREITFSTQVDTGHNQRLGLGLAQDHIGQSCSLSLAYINTRVPHRFSYEFGLHCCFTVVAWLKKNAVSTPDIRQDEVLVAIYVENMLAV